jgi:hypothetical protein
MDAKPLEEPRAGEEYPNIGKPDCPQCHGSGFVVFTRRVEITGIAPYDADFAALCACRGGK